MAKLTDDPKIAELVAKETAKTRKTAVADAVRTVKSHVKEYLESTKGIEDKAQRKGQTDMLKGLQTKIVDELKAEPAAA